MRIWDGKIRIRDGKSLIRDLGSGINISDPQHWCDVTQLLVYQVSACCKAVPSSNLGSALHGNSLC
jgi:hypothetical protein